MVPIILHSSTKPHPVTRRELVGCTILAAAFTAFSGVASHGVKQDVDTLRQTPTVETARSLQERWKIIPRHQWRQLPPAQEIKTTTDHATHSRNFMYLITGIGGFTTLAFGVLAAGERKRDDDDQDSGKPKISDPDKTAELSARQMTYGWDVR